MALFSPIAERFSDKLEPKTVASIGMAFCAAGLSSAYPEKHEGGFYYFFVLLFQRHFRVACKGKGEVNHGQKGLH
jgi:hypothetical protein